MELEQDYFSLLDLPKSYSVDKKKLKSNARILLRQYHPDRFSASTSEEQRLAEQLAAHINFAVRVLEDPIQRAQHLLSLADIDANFDNRTIQDNAFLIQQMELRESFDEVMESDGQGLTPLVEEVEAELSVVEGVFEKTDFKNAEAVRAEQETLLATLAKLHFFIKLNADLKTAQKEPI